ncbi:MAG: type II secretion system F family protein [Patescibacteria group bacterium]
MLFSYKAISNGQFVNGKVEANNLKEVTEYLRNNNFFPVKIEETKPVATEVFTQLLDKISTSDIVNFTRQFALMLNAGLTISSSFDILNSQATKPSMRKLYTTISTDIKSGENLSKSFAKRPEIFSKLYVSLVKAGEASGKLNEIMLRLADDMEKQQEYMGKIKGTMTYPIIIIVGVIGVVMVLLTVVIPQLTGMYKDLGIELPMSTQILISLSTFLQYAWPLLLAAVFGVWVGIKKYFASEEHRFALYKILMKLPIVGPILKISSLVTSTSTLSLLISSGVLVLESINIIINSTSNVVFQRAFRNVYKSIQDGATISQAFAKEDTFPPILIQMTAVGERTGKLDEILMKLSRYFEIQSDLAVKTVTTLIEPATLVILGGVVFLIVMSVLSPIYTLTSSVGAQ